MWRLRLSYWSLVCLRILAAVFTYGYIHPDVYFQSGEIWARSYAFPGLAAVAGPSTVDLPWEWQPKPPGQSRSVLPMMILVAIPQWLFARLPSAFVSSVCILTTERLWMCILTIIADFAIGHLSLTLSGSQSESWRSQILFALGGPAFTFLTMTFSNTLEMFVVLALMCLVLPPAPRISPARAFLIGMVSSFGIFVRFTFPLFVWPLGVYWFVRQRPRPLQVSIAFIGAAVIALVCVLVDTYWFTGLRGISICQPSSWVLTPVNNFLYNVRVENLEQHGLHPRWTHALVNFPLLFGGPITLLLAGSYWARHWTTTLAHQRVLILMTVASVFGFSLAPHQEARFLLPLFPSIILLLALPTLRSASVCANFAAWTIVFSVLFGYLHQAGVSNLLCNPPPELRDEKGHLLFYNTYMPPLHALARKETANLRVHDAAGSETKLQRILGELAANCSPIYIAAPASVNMSPLAVTKVNSFWPHMSLESLPMGLGELALTLYRFRSNCTNH